MQIPIEPSFIKRLKKGDQQAISEWYDHSAPALLGLCMRYCNSTPDAEDLLHNALMKVIRSISSFNYQGPGRFEAWVKRIVVNTALNFIRSEMRNKNVPFDDALHSELFAENHEDEVELPPLPDPEELLGWVRMLPFGYRTVLNLYVFEGYTHKEIAEKLSITENTSKSQLSKARRFLRNIAEDKSVHLEFKGNE
ncbi:MAG: RNA polymerase sigma factor [Bacteroidales bacterium]|nr:RNA polymerase sigma factor [Bacteroidales bacterium]